MIEAAHSSRGFARLAAMMIAATALLGLCARPASAIDGDSGGMTPLARLFEGIPHAVTLVDPWAFVGLDSGLAIYDISDPSRPVRQSHVYLPSPAYDVVVDGIYAYVANGESGLQIIDIADTFDPVRVGSIPSSIPGATVSGVAIAGTVACLSEHGAVARLVCVDIDNPVAPFELDRIGLPNGALDVAIASGVAFVAIGSDPSAAAGIVAIDITDPGNLQMVAGGSLTTDKPVHQIAIADNIAYLATGYASSGAFVTADVSIPGSPRLLTSVPLSDVARGVAVQSGIALVASSSLGLLSFDVTDPMLPRALDAQPTGRQSTAVASRGDVALVADRSSIGSAALTSIRTMFPSSLIVEGSVPFAESTDSATAPGLAFLLQREALYVVDTSNPLAPSVLSAWRPPGADFTAVAGNSSLVAVGDGARVYLVDVVDPFNPTPTGSITVDEGLALRLTLDGTVLYVVTGMGLETFDVTSPAAPAPLGSFPTSGWSSAIAVDGTTGYLAAGDTLHVLDLSAPSFPVEVGSLMIVFEQLFGVAVDGDQVVVTGLTNALYTISVTDPMLPVLQGFVIGGSAFDVRLVGTRAIVAAGAAGIQVVDLSDPLSPLIEAWYDTSGEVYALDIEGDSVFAAALGSQHWLTRCDSCSGGCIETWPKVAPNSLRAVRSSNSVNLRWSISGGIGLCNLHRTLVKTELMMLWSNMATVIDSTPLSSSSDGFDPGPSVAHYRVFGAGSCTGNSVKP